VAAVTQRNRRPVDEITRLHRNASIVCRDARAELLDPADAFMAEDDRKGMTPASPDMMCTSLPQTPPATMRTNAPPGSGSNTCTSQVSTRLGSTSTHALPCSCLDPLTGPAMVQRAPCGAVSGHPGRVLDWHADLGTNLRRQPAQRFLPGLGIVNTVMLVGHDIPNRRRHRRSFSSFSITVSGDPHRITCSTRKSLIDCIGSDVDTAVVDDPVKQPELDVDFLQILVPGLH